MRRLWIAVIAVLLLAFAGGALLWQQFASDGAVRQRLVAVLSRQTGRRVAIGHAHLHLLPSPRLLADDVAIGDVLRIAHLRAAIAFPPLLSRDVRVRTLTLDGVGLHLHHDPDGRGNWQVAPVPGTARHGGGHAPGRRWRVQLDGLVLRTAAIDWRLPHASGAVHLRALHASGLRGAAPQFRLAGVANGADYGIDGTVRPAHGGAPWPVTVRARETIGGVVVARGTLSGTIASRHDYDLTGALTLSDLVVLDRLFPNAKLPPAKAVSIDLQARDDGHPALLSLHAHGGAATLPGADLGALRSWRVDAAGTGAPVQVAADGDWHDAPLHLEGRLGTLQALAEAASRAVSRHSASLLLRGIDADLALSAPGGGAAGGLASGRLRVNGAATPVAWRLSLRPWSMPATSLSRLLGMADAVRGTAELVGELDASGDTRTALRASLAGHLGVSVVDGTLSDTLLAGLLGHDSAITAMLPRQGGVPLRCLALHAAVARGQASFDTIDLQTAPVSLRGHGSLALEGGGLDLHLLAKARIGAAAASVPVGVSGSLRDPRAALDRAGPGGRYVLSLGPSTDGGPGGESGCEAALRQAREGLAGPAPPARKKPKGGAIGILRGLGLMR